MDKTHLKLVKVNQREVEEPYYASKYSTKPSGTKKVKHHDLEYHHAVTGEPVFTVKSDGHGDTKHSIQWHPYQKQLHPDLERSFEHGSRHQRRGYMSSKSKDILDYMAAKVYEHAARSGFRDKLPSKVSPAPGSDDPNTHITSIHDPETGEMIAHQRSGYREGIKVNPDYLNNHGIDRSILHASGENLYDVAQKVHANKGISHNAIGFRHYSNYGHGTSVYVLGRGKTPEEASAAHEKHVREKEPRATITRHSPTAFHAHVPQKGEYDDEHHIHSMVMGDRLISTSAAFDTRRDYKGTPLEHKF